MPYSISLGDIIELSFVGTLYLQQVMTVLHYEVETAPPADDAFAQLTTFLDDLALSPFLTSYLACVTNDAQYGELRIQVVAPERRPVVVKPLAQTGGAIGSAGTANVSAVIIKRTDVITKRKLKLKKGGTGSVHVPGVPTNTYANGLILPGFKTVLQSLADKILLTQGIGGTGVMFPCLWHRTSAAPNSFDVLVQANPASTVRVERRRTVGLGI